MRGIDVRAAKAGPDYIDPAFHAISSGRASINLDPWAMNEQRCRELARLQLGTSQHLLIESMMGLFDGATDGSGSGAQLATTLGIGVVLVVDGAKQSHSIAALVRGFRDHDEDTKLCGVIINRVGGYRHEQMLRQALEQINMPVIGAIAKSEDFQLPERHLGLVQAGEISAIDDFIAQAAKRIGEQCDLEALMQCFQPMDLKSPGPVQRINPPGQNIAIARDEAFSFIYPHLVGDWRAQGSQISYFSPLVDEGPAQDADAVILPGGYPELHGAKIATAGNFSRLMHKARDRGALIYGECGGYMVLGNGLVDSSGKRHKMLGFLQLETSFEARKLHLGYRRLVAADKFFAGEKLKGHEFHYTSAMCEIGKSLFGVEDALGNKLGQHGLRNGNVMGSYMHLIDVTHG